MNTQLNKILSDLSVITIILQETTNFYKKYDSVEIYDFFKLNEIILYHLLSSLDDLSKLSYKMEKRD